MSYRLVCRNIFKKCLLFFFSILISVSAYSQNKVKYKQIDSVNLGMEIFYPDIMDPGKKYPAMVFYFGGGWMQGTIKHFEHHAKYFSQRGMVCFLVDYRVTKRHQSTPFVSLKDAKSAIRFIKENADRFQLDTTKIVASGGSAGGHLAAATAIIEAYNDPMDNLQVSCKPNALVLFNPVVDNGPGGYGYDRVGEAYKDFSPLHNLRAGLPPTICFLGTKDALIPVETLKYYQKIMERTGNICELHIYEGGTHGFFNYDQFEFYKQTLLKADQFLQSLGFLNPEPKVNIE